MKINEIGTISGRKLRHSNKNHLSKSIQLRSVQIMFIQACHAYIILLYVYEPCIQPKNTIQFLHLCYWQLCKFKKIQNHEPVRNKRHHHHQKANFSIFNRRMDGCFPTRYGIQPTFSDNSVHNSILINCSSVGILVQFLFPGKNNFFWQHAFADANYSPTLWDGVLLWDTTSFIWLNNSLFVIQYSGQFLIQIFWTFYLCISKCPYVKALYVHHPMKPSYINRSSIYSNILTCNNIDLLVGSYLQWLCSFLKLKIDKTLIKNIIIPEIYQIWTITCTNHHIVQNNTLYTNEHYMLHIIVSKYIIYVCLAFSHLYAIAHIKHHTASYIEANCYHKFLSNRLLFKTHQFFIFIIRNNGLSKIDRSINDRLLLLSLQDSWKEMKSNRSSSSSSSSSVYCPFSSKKNQG